MHDERPVVCTLVLTALVAAALAAGWLLGGETTREAIFAAPKLVVIR